ncbi:MAG TPA: universal stress protein [Bryobacteraceae bacterium]|jgi:nucleotide-binding universal stress UspA family protein|nr:universal stress protein [Bryobacteraceae bacterium]
MGFLARILAPVEFSERCVGAVRYAKMLAEHFGAELVLLHVLAPPPPEMGADACRRRAGQLEQQLTEFLADELAGVSVRRVLLEGDPAATIVAYAHEQQAGLILMPTHGFGPFRRFILGSNTAKVLHDADRPVWTGAHMEETPPGPSSTIANILCAVDLGPQSAKALSWAVALQNQFAARLTLLHATLAIPAMAKGAEANWNVVVRAAAQKELELLQKQRGATADLLVEAGEPAQVIAAAASRLHADVVVIARGSAAGGFGRLRTNAYAVIRQSPCPVVSV